MNLNRSALALALALPLFGCDAPPDAQPPVIDAPREAPLISTLQVDGAELRFYDVETDIVTVAIGDAQGASPVKALPRDGRLSAVDLHRQLAPSRPVPEALLSTQRRVEDFRRTHPSSGKHPPRAGTESIAQAVSVFKSTADAAQGTPGTTDARCPAWWFQDQFCTGGDGANLGPGCAFDRFGGGYSSGTISDTDRTRGAVCVFTGTATYRAWHRTWWSWNSIAPVSIPAGKYGVIFTSDGLDYDYSESIDQSAGVGYHRRLNYCLSSWGCG